MSYILDALKRADAERERGQVPGLHSQPGRTPASPDAQARQAAHPPNGRRLWMMALTVLVVAVLSVTLWPERGVPPPTGHAPAPVTPASVTASTATPPAPPPVVAANTPAPPVSPILAPPPTPTVQQAPTQPVATATPAAPTKSTSTVVRFADLTAEQRTQLPQLNVSGASYSENPAHRLLIVNGQVVQEGQELAPGLVLERIGAREAVLNQRGLRFSVGY